MDTPGQEGTHGATTGPGTTKSDAEADAQSAMTEAADAIEDKARDAAEDVKARSADQITGMTRAARKAADELSRELPQAAGFIHSTAEKLEGASARLREKSIEDLVANFGDFTRRQPAVAFAGAVLAGFALSRFLKSSARSETQQ
ncbi:MAG TPA: hypothetical protein VFL51_17215 [Pseudolabrys sp.]|nr:hypothetical protein [Pseudolabrys sp.]